MECKTRPSTTNTPFSPPKHPPWVAQTLEPPSKQGTRGLGVLWVPGVTPKRGAGVGGDGQGRGTPPPPLSRSQPTAPQPMLVGGEGLGGAPPTLGCPLQEGCSGGPRGGALGRAPHYLLAWGERGFWGDGAPALAGVQPAPTSGTGCCAQVRHPPRQGGVAALPC